MAKKGVLKQIWTFIAWLTGVLVSLAVGFGMVDGTLPIRFIPGALTSIAGWIVIILALIGAIIAIIDYIKQ